MHLQSSAVKVINPKLFWFLKSSFFFLFKPKKTCTYLVLITICTRHISVDSLWTLWYQATPCIATIWIIIVHWQNSKSYIVFMYCILRMYLVLLMSNTHSFIFVFQGGDLLLRGIFDTWMYIIRVFWDNHIIIPCFLYLLLSFTEVGIIIAIGERKLWIR